MDFRISKQLLNLSLIHQFNHLTHFLNKVLIIILRVNLSFVVFWGVMLQNNPDLLVTHLSAESSVDMSVWIVLFSYPVRDAGLDAFYLVAATIGNLGF